MKEFKTLKEFYEYCENYTDNEDMLYRLRSICEHIIWGQSSELVLYGYSLCFISLVPEDVSLCISHSVNSISSELMKYINLVLSGKPAPEDVEFFRVDNTAPHSETAEQD